MFMWLIQQNTILTKDNSVRRTNWHEYKKCVFLLWKWISHLFLLYHGHMCLELGGLGLWELKIDQDLLISFGYGSTDYYQVGSNSRWLVWPWFAGHSRKPETCMFWVKADAITNWSNLPCLFIYLLLDRSAARRGWGEAEGWRWNTQERCATIPSLGSESGRCGICPLK